MFQENEELILDLEGVKDPFADLVEEDEEDKGFDSNNGLVELQLKIESVIFINEVAGYGIFSANASGRKKYIYANDDGRMLKLKQATVEVKDPNVENILKVGNKVLCLGTWVNNDKYGLQFRAEEISAVMLTENKDIEKFLLNNGMKSVNEDIASKLINFTDATGLLIDTLLSNPDLMVEAKLTSDQARKVALEWFGYKQSFLFASEMRKYGLHRAKAVKIYHYMISKLPEGKTEYEKRVNVRRFYEETDYNHYKHMVNLFFTDNPYDLIDINGIGFKTIDEVALNYGFQELDERRVAGYTFHRLQERMNGSAYMNEKTQRAGDVVVPIEVLMNDVCQLRGLNRSLAQEIVKDYLKKRRIVLRTMDLGDGPKKYVTTVNYFISEFFTAKKLSFLNNAEINNAKQGLKALDDGFLKVDPSQADAIRNSYNAPVSIITGGPGTGKTYTIANLIRLLCQFNPNKEIVLLAPTGKATKRIHENIVNDIHLSKFSIEKPKTIHKFIRIQASRDEEISSDTVFIVDESSMIDTMLFNKLLRYIPVGAQLILVGDIYQIPPVQEGQIMRDMMESGQFPVSYLTNTHRVGKNSDIPYYANLIKDGKMPPILQKDDDWTDEDFAFIETENDVETFSFIEELVQHFLSSGEAKDDIQLIAPQQRGVVGVGELNRVLRWMLNRDVDYTRYKENTIIFKDQIDMIEGDKILNNKNDYNKDDPKFDIFNGDMGYCTKLDLIAKKFVFEKSTDEDPVEVSFSKRKQFSLAYAITVHKSQGSESPIIIMPISKSHLITLNRYLVYTGVTRARKKVILVGQPYVLKMAINKVTQGERYTGFNFEWNEWRNHEQVVSDILDNVVFNDEIEESDWTL